MSVKGTLIVDGPAALGKRQRRTREVTQPMSDDVAPLPPALTPETPPEGATEMVT